MANTANKCLKIKICGMREASNMKEIAALQPDYMGFIFYKPSPRYITPQQAKELMTLIPESTKRIGVFVNEREAVVLDTVETVGLDGVQLHGEESPEYCQRIREKGILVIKAFPVAPDFDFKKLTMYLNVCDYFLFDTRTPNYGGSGEKFDWHLLDSYTLGHPFFLSGGISPEDAEGLKKISLPGLEVLDLNSRFETEPGVKNSASLQKFMETIHS